MTNLDSYNTTNVTSTKAKIMFIHLGLEFVLEL